MVVSVQDVLDYLQMDLKECVVRRKVKAVERLIREETQNNFQNRQMRFYAASSGGLLTGSSPYLQPGDTVEINDSINAGLYTVEEIAEGMVRLDKALYDTASNMVTKVVYPEDVQEGVLNMLQWDFTMRSKTGIKSETLSRHSVTYYDMDHENSLDGYPASLVGFLEPYRQMRW